MGLTKVFKNKVALYNGLPLGVEGVLPLYYSGPFSESNSFTDFPERWSWQLNDGSNDSLEGPSEGTSGRMNLVGHFVAIDVSGLGPSSVSYWLNKAGPNQFRQILVQHSTDNTNWTTVRTLNDFNIPEGGAGNGTNFIDAIPSSAQYIRFYMSERNGGRIEIDGITVS
jgi:hypothetical protein